MCVFVLFIVFLTLYNGIKKNGANLLYNRNAKTKAKHDKTEVKRKREREEAKQRNTQKKNDFIK